MLDLLFLIPLTALLVGIMVIIASKFVSSTSENPTKSNMSKSQDPTVSGKSGTDLRILDWNLKSYCGTDGPDGGAAIEALINDKGPWDLTGFQETGTASKLNLTGLRLVDETYKNNNSIWVATDATVRDSGSIDVTWDQWGARSIQWVVVDIPDKGTIMFAEHHGCIACADGTYGPACEGQTCADAIDGVLDEIGFSSYPQRFFVCDCNTWSGVVTALNTGGMDLLQNSEPPVGCGILDRIYYNSDVYSVIQGQSFGGNSGCNDTACPGGFDSDHSSVWGTFTLL
jgi:hypothetical protein